MKTASGEKNRLMRRDNLQVGLEVVRAAQFDALVELQLEVNGEPLLDRFPYDLRGLSDAELPPSRHFFGKAADDLRVGDQVALLVCPVCGDLGCGAVTARITVLDDEVTWSDFLYGVNYVPSEDRPFDYTFVFERRAYEAALAEAAEAARAIG